MSSASFISACACPVRSWPSGRAGRLSIAGSLLPSVCLALVALASGAQDPEGAFLRGASRDDARFAPLAAAYEAGDMSGVSSGLADLLRKDPASEQVNFAFGQMALRMGRISHAILAFERVLGANPENDRARLELARAYFALEQYPEARAQFDRVLANDPPPAVKRNIEQYISRMSYVRLGWRYRGRIEAGVLYDGNVNFGPASQIIAIHPTSIGGIWVDQLQLAPDSTRKSAWGGYAAASMLFSFRAHRPTRWSLEGFGRAQGNSLAGASKYNLTFLHFGIGPRYAGADYAMDLPARVEYVIRGGDSLATVLGLAPVYSRRLSPTLTLAAIANADYRYYAGDPNRDGFFYAAGAQLIRALGSQSQASLGLRLIAEQPKADIWKNKGLEGYIGGSTRMLDRASLYGSASVRLSSYDEREALAPEDRRDVQWGLAGGVDWHLGADWSCDMNVQYTRCNSTFDLYDYNRLAASWSVHYDF